MKSTENMIEKLYSLNEEELMEKISQKWKEQKKAISKEEEVSKKLACYTEESYKQGLKDGINLILNAKEDL